MMTSTAPITSASATLKIPRSMKFFSRNSSRVDDDVRRQRRFDFRERCGDVVGQLPCVDVRLLDDREHDSRVTIDAAVASFELRAFRRRERPVPAARRVSDVLPTGTFFRSSMTTRDRGPKPTQECESVVPFHLSPQIHRSC